MNFKKVLVSAPTSKEKNYCFDSWIKNVMDFKYPNFDIALFDNTPDGGNNAEYLNQRVIELYGNYKMFKALNSFRINKIKNPPKSIIERICISHNDCRQTFINGKYDYLLHLETDVFPDCNVIEQLMQHGKKVVGAVYFRDSGKWRKPMLQRKIYLSPTNIKTENFKSGEEVYFLDSKLKEVAHVGLGCCLINKTVFDKIKFRFVSSVDMFPDSYFAEDCFRKKIPIYCDTSSLCRHENQDWGIYGRDFI